MPTSKTIAKRVASEMQAPSKPFKHLHGDQDPGFKWSNSKCSLGTAPSNWSLKHQPPMTNQKDRLRQLCNINPIRTSNHLVVVREFPPPPCGPQHHHNGRRLNQPEWLDPIPFLYWLTQGNTQMFTRGTTIIARVKQRKS